MEKPSLLRLELFRQFIQLLIEGIGLDAHGTAIFIHLETVGPASESNIGNIALIVAHKPGGVRMEIHLLCLAGGTRMVHVNLVHTRGQYIQIMHHLVDGL